MSQKMLTERVEPTPGEFEVKVSLFEGDAGENDYSFRLSQEQARSFARNLQVCAMDPMACEECIKAGSTLERMSSMGTWECWVCKRWFIVGLTIGGYEFRAPQGEA